MPNKPGKSKWMRRIAWLYHAIAGVGMVFGIANWETTGAVWSDWLTGIDPLAGLSEEQMTALLFGLAFTFGVLVSMLITLLWVRWQEPAKRRMAEVYGKISLRVLDTYHEVSERVFGVPIEFWYFSIRGSRRITGRKRFRLRPGQSAYISPAWRWGTAREYGNQSLVLNVRLLADRHILKFFGVDHTWKEKPLLGVQSGLFVRTSTMAGSFNHRLAPWDLEHNNGYLPDRIKIVLERHEY